MKLLATILLSTYLVCNLTGSSVTLAEEPVLVYPDEMQYDILRFNPFEPVIDEIIVEKVETEIVQEPEPETETEIIEEVVVEPEVEVVEEEFVSVSFIPEHIQKLCYKIGPEYDLSPALLIAIIEQESGGDAKAVNKRTKCMGLMQLHPKYADYYLNKAGASDPFNPEDNIRAGCEILKEKLKQYKHLPLALMKYHGESDATKKYKTGKYSSYCKKILNRMNEMEE